MTVASKNTWQQMIASVQRMPGLEDIPLGEIIDAVRTAAVDIGNMPWPWNYTETNVLVPAPHTEGTITINDQTSTVTGTGTSWPTGLNGWRMRFGTSNMDYIVQQIVSPTAITLAQPINLGANQTNISYTLWKDTYTYPADYIIGSDVGLFLPVIRSRVQKLPRAKFEAAMNSGLRSFSTNIAQFYCNTGQIFDPVTQGPLYAFRIAPPPSGPAELRLCYHGIATNPVTPVAGNPIPIVTFTGMSDLPDGYDEAIELTAASKLYDLMKMPGESEGVKRIAEAKLKLLRRAVSVDIIDDIPDPQIEVPDSSISQWGMTISRMS